MKWLLVIALAIIVVIMGFVIASSDITISSPETSVSAPATATADPLGESLSYQISKKTPTAEMINPDDRFCGTTPSVSWYEGDLLKTITEADPTLGAQLSPLMETLGREQVEKRMEEIIKEHLEKNGCNYPNGITWEKLSAGIFDHFYW